MEKYHKILVCLDHSKFDISLIRVVNKICEMGPREITFVNIIRDYEIPDEVVEAFPDFMENAIQERKKVIEATITKHFKWPEIDVDVQVKHGQPAKTILKVASKRNIDLIISGKKQNSLGIVRSRLARRADCSFLLIAKESLPNFVERVLVPIDFSEHSRMAIERAVSFVDLVPNRVEIFAQNVFHVPTGYHYTGKSYKEFVEIMKANAMKNFESFIKTVNINGKEIKSIFSLNDNDNFVSDIKDEAENLKVSLLIIGAKGQTATSSLLIGSRAERLVMMDTNSSILVVRSKGQRSGFKEFLQEL